MSEQIENKTENKIENKAERETESKSEIKKVSKAENKSEIKTESKPENKAVKQERILNNRTAGILSACAVVLVAVLAAVSVVFVERMDDKTFEERKSHMIEFTEKLSEIMQEKVSATWKEVVACEYILGKDSTVIEGKEALIAELSSMKAFESSDDTIVIVYDDEGMYYSSDGHNGKWNAKTMIDMVGPEGTQTVVSMPNGHDENEEYLMFLDRLDDVIYIGDGDIRLTHLAVAINTESLSKQLTISGFGRECYSYVINMDGQRLYRYSYDVSQVPDENLIESVARYNIVNGGTYEDFAENVREGVSSALEFRYVDKDTGKSRDWFVANANVVGIGWQIVMFVPTDVLASNTQGLLTSLRNYFIIMSFIVICLFILAIFTLLAGRADKRIIMEKEESNAMLSEAVKKAEDASVAKSEFLSRMSHDIRTPINGIMGMTGIAMKNIDDKAKVSDCLKKIDSSSHHLLKLINDVLDMSRIEAGRTTFEKRPFNLRECLDNCADIIEGQLVTRDIELIRSFDKIENPYVLGDELHLRQVFINILGNAVKFTHDGGKIYFKAKPVEMDGKPAFRFRIQDTGIGMKQEFIPHLFEAFAQEDEGARTNYKGSGLGMAIVKQFVDMMGGTIEVESVLNQGTRFDIRIPMETDEKRLAKSGEEGADSDDLRGMKVLLVEDNDLNLEIAQDILTEAGINVTTARNGRFALEAFLATNPGEFDAILMDVMMPVMNGLEATRAIRNVDRPDAKTVPIIAMTANAYDEDIRRTQEAGMNAHLAKPIEVDKLYVKLGKCYNARLKREG